MFASALGTPLAATPQTLTSLLAALDLRGYAPGTSAPDFSGRSLDARPVSLAGLHGKVVVLNFWATWCLECRPEMPKLEQVHREFAAQGLVVVGINAREKGDPVRVFARQLNLTFPLVLDPDGKINTLYGVVGLPTTFVVGRDARAVALGVGPRDWTSPSARGLIRALLAEAVPGSR